MAVEITRLFLLQSENNYYRTLSRNLLRTITYKFSHPPVPLIAPINVNRAFKKSSANGKLTLYLASRDLIVNAGKIDKLQGVLLIDPEILQEKKVRYIPSFYFHHS